MISFDDFKKVELRVGRILSAEKVPDTDKLLRLMVDLGEIAPRQILSGIALYFPMPEELVGVTCVFVVNLEPRTIRGLESNGMILAASTEDGNFSVLRVDAKVSPGTLIK
jgi:methionine--tRNA ligase beta chain